MNNKIPPDVLRVDWDAHDGTLSVGEVCKRLRRAGFRVVWWAEEYSPSGRGRHLTLRLRPGPKDPMTVTALQAILNSDPLREACNVARARVLDKTDAFWRKRWNVFYRRLTSNRKGQRHGKD